MPFAAQAADVNVYGLVATGLYYQKTEGADNGNVGMAQYKQTPTDSHFGITGREDLGNGLYVGFQLENGYVCFRSVFGLPQAPREYDGVRTARHGTGHHGLQRG